MRWGESEAITIITIVTIVGMNIYLQANVSLTRYQGFEP